MGKFQKFLNQNGNACKYALVRALAEKYKYDSQQHKRLGTLKSLLAFEHIEYYHTSYFDRWS